MTSITTSTSGLGPTCRSSPVSLPVFGFRRQFALGGLRLTNRSLLRKTVLNGKRDDSIDEAFQKGSKFMDTATDYVPSSVPRPVAKTGVAIVSGLIILWLIRTVFEVFSVVLFLVTIGGIGYFVLKSQNKDSKTIDLEKVDDPISEAERIMDKYR